MANYCRAGIKSLRGTVAEKWVVVGEGRVTPPAPYLFAAGLWTDISRRREWLFLHLVYLFHAKNGSVGYVKRACKCIGLLKRRKKLMKKRNYGLGAQKRVGCSGCFIFVPVVT